MKIDELIPDVLQTHANYMLLNGSCEVQYVYQKFLQKSNKIPGCKKKNKTLRKSCENCRKNLSKQRAWCQLCLPDAILNLFDRFMD